MPTMELPLELEVPTCVRCKKIHLDRMDQKALRAVYMRSLQSRVCVALDVLHEHVSWRWLESRLGISQGYVSRLRAKAGCPSPELAVLLAMLATDPSLLGEIESFWATPDSTWQPSRRNPAPPTRRVRPPESGAQRRLAEVRDQTDIVSVIGQYVKLRRSGVDYCGACPFHKDKDADFHVSVSRQFYYCFGCKRSGDVVSFLVEKEKRTQADVVADLTSRAGIE